MSVVRSEIKKKYNKTNKEVLFALSRNDYLLTVRHINQNNVNRRPGNWQLATILDSLSLTLLRMKKVALKCKKCRGLCFLIYRSQTILLSCGWLKAYLPILIFEGCYWKQTYFLRLKSTITVTITRHLVHVQYSVHVGLLGIL